MSLSTEYTVWTSKPSTNSQETAWVEWDKAPKQKLIEAIERSATSLQDSLQTFKSIAISETAAFSQIR